MRFVRSHNFMRSGRSASSFDRTQRTLRVENIGKGIGLEDGGFGGGGALESSKVELFRKRLLKAILNWRSGNQIIE